MKWFGVFLLIGGIVLFGFFLYPSFRNYVEEEIFRADVNPGEIRVIKGQILEQEFRTTDEKIGGVILVTKSEENRKRAILVEIEDANGKTLEKMRHYSVSFLEGRNLFRFIGKSIQFEKNKIYNIRVTLEEGENVVMKVREKSLNSTPLKIDGKDTNFNLVFSVLYNRGLNTDSAWGVLVGLGFLFGSFLINLMKDYSRKYLIAGLLVMMLIPAGVSGFWFSNGAYGIADWDLNAPIQQGYRDAILKYGQFPFWNAIPCGGSAALADPEFSVVSVPFLMVLLFGVQTGFKFGILFTLLVLALGSFMLAKQAQISPHGAMIVSLIVTAGGAFILHLVEGHIYICFAYAWMPWFIWAWNNAYKKKKHYYWPGIFLTLMFMQGGVYIITYSLIVYIALVIFARQKIVALKTSLFSGIWFCGISAVKLIPALFWLSHYKDEEYSQSGNTLAHLYDIYLSKHLHGASVIYGQGVGWHELGAYVGPIVILLVLVALFLGWKERRTRVWLVASLVAIFFSTAGEKVKFITDSINFLPRSDFSRFVMLAAIPLALLAGYGLDRLVKKVKLEGVAFFIVGLVAIDLFSLAFPLSRQTFVMPSILLDVQSASYPIVYNWDRLPKVINGREYTRRYLYTLKGYGFMDYCPSLEPVVGVTSYNRDVTEFFPFVKAVNGGKVILKKWSHNSFVVGYSVDKKTVILANQNYAPGWTANGQPVLNIKNRIAAEVAAGNGEVIFSFVPEGLSAGLIISFVSIILLCLITTPGGFLTRLKQSVQKKIRGEN